MRNWKRNLTAVILGCAVSLGFSMESHSQGFHPPAVVARGLIRPTGIAIRGSGTLYFTQIPTPGVGGGMNSVSKLVLASGNVTTLHEGEPEPVNIALGKDGTVYWTCKSAGVILEQTHDGTTTPLLTGLTKPSGIAVDRWDNVYYTLLPTPGKPGSMGGTNTTNVFDGTSSSVLTMGEPEPTDIAVSRDGDVYWTCKSANVILKRTPDGVVSVLLSGLDKPVGIAVDHQGKKLYFTEVPTPGVPGSMGGRNRITELNLETGTQTVVHFGDPEPTDVTVAKNGSVYWTCSSAGVILEAEPIRGE